MDKSLTDRFWEMRHGLQRSYYYYESRLHFWVLFLFLTKSIEFLVGYPAVKSLFQGSDYGWNIILTIGAGASFLISFFEAHKRIKILRMQKRVMGDCLAMMPSDDSCGDDDLYAKIKSKRVKAERKDDVILEVLDAMCYNKASKTLGAQEKYHITKTQKFFGWWLPLPFTTEAQLEGQEDDARARSA